MKKTLSLLIIVLSLGLASLDADAARRFGGGGNLGKQRATPTQRESTPPSAAPAAPTQAAKPAQPAPSATPAGLPPPKPTFMQRWGGLLAGLGIGALLASLFGAQMGPIVGMILAVLLGAVVIGFLMKMFAAGRRPATEPAANFDRRVEPAFSGIGSRVEPSTTEVAPANDASMVLGGPVDPFLRVAKTSFLRLQAANDAGDLDDIRDYTTPEMYAEIAMQVRDRKGATQKTEVLNVDASITDAAIEGDYAYASVRFWGLIRETPGANPEPFDEVWHVRRKAGNPKDPWLIAGIQQVAELLLRRLAPVARHAQRAEHRHPLVALVDGTHCGAVFLCAGDVRLARRLDLELAGDRHRGAEAIPALRILQADAALAHHVDRGAHEDEGRLVGGLIVHRGAAAHAEDLHAGSDGRRSGRALLERRALSPGSDARVERGLVFLVGGETGSRGKGDGNCEDRFHSGGIAGGGVGGGGGGSN